MEKGVFNLLYSLNKISFSLIIYTVVLMFAGRDCCALDMLNV